MKGRVGGQGGVPEQKVLTVPSGNINNSVKNLNLFQWVS